MAKQRPDRLTALRGELVQTRAALDAKIESVRDELLTEMRRQHEETRRHFDVVAESLRSQLQVVAEAALVGNASRERLATEVDGRFRVVDGRLVRLEARVFGSPQP